MVSLEIPPMVKSLLPHVKKSLFEQEETEGCGREELRAWPSALFQLKNYGL